MNIHHTYLCMCLLRWFCCVNNIFIIESFGIYRHTERYTDTDIQTYILSHEHEQHDKNFVSLGFRSPHDIYVEHLYFIFGILHIKLNENTQNLTQNAVAWHDADRNYEKNTQIEDVNVTQLLIVTDFIVGFFSLSLPLFWLKQFIIIIIIIYCHLIWWCLSCLFIVT